MSYTDFMKLFILFLGILAPVWVFAQATPAPQYADTRSDESQETITNAFIDFFRKQNATKPNVSVSLSLSPPAVAPFSNITAYARSSGEGIGNALVVWYRNGKEVQRGKGMTSYNFLSGDVGAQETLEITVTFSGGAVKTSRIIIRPASVRFLWEADTFTPTWYKGGTLAVPASRITVRAYPTILNSGNSLNRSALRYDWEINRVAQRSESGVGRDFISFSAGQNAGITQNVTVNISDQNGDTLGRGNISIPVNQPEVNIYRQLPLLGVVIEDQSSRFSAQAGKSLTMRAIPFYALREAGVFSWSTRNEDLEKTVDPYAITVHIPDSGNVSQIFKASLSYPLTFLRAESSVTIESN